jgi:chromosome segregation ATPase
MDFLSLSMKSQLKHASKGAVDFTAILKMVDEMVAVLEAEEADDAKHKSWCTAELSSSEDEMKGTEGKLSSITTSIAEASDEAAGLAEDVTGLNAKVAGLDKDVAVATEMRKADHAEYLETIALTEAAIGLIGKAKNRLNKFYNPALYKPPPKEELSAEDRIVANLGASFVQVHHHSKLVPPKFEASFLQKAYQPKTAKSGGALALMDSLVADLKSSLGEAEHEEKTAQTDYTELMSDSQATRASDNKAISDKSAAKADLEGKIVSMKENKALTEDALVNVHAYISELHGSCDFILDNFQLRSDARKNEIESLKNAKAVLSGASYS